MSLITKYTPQLGKPRPWADLELDFCRWFGEQYMHSIAELIRHIRTSGLDKRLFGLSSMDKLVVSIYEPIEWNREALHITFNTTTRRWHFVYYALPFREPEFVRDYDLEEGIEKFDNFIKMINW
jgi:hypothetical protein